MDYKKLDSVIFEIKKIIQGDINSSIMINDELLREKVIKFIESIVDEQSPSSSSSPDLDLTINRCMGCGVDLGDYNPRQYCCKTYCPDLIHN
jgi:hypothetical protein